MAEIYFTIAGTNHHHGQEFIEPKMEVKLVKDDLVKHYCNTSV